MSTSFPGGLSLLPSSEPAAVSQSWATLRRDGELGDALAKLEQGQSLLAEAVGQATVLDGLDRAQRIAAVGALVRHAAEELRRLVDGTTC